MGGGLGLEGVPGKRSLTERIQRKAHGTAPPEEAAPAAMDEGAPTAGVSDTATVDDGGGDAFEDASAADDDAALDDARGEGEAAIEEPSGEGEPAIDDPSGEDEAAFEGERGADGEAASDDAGGEGDAAFDDEGDEGDEGEATPDDRGGVGRDAGGMSQAFGIDLSGAPAFGDEMAGGGFASGSSPDLAVPARDDAAVQRRGAGHADDSDAVHAAAASGTAGTGARLPYYEQIQQAFGPYDVGQVRAHVGGAASSACDAIGAEAYASGDAVAFRGAPDLHTAAHEAAHVVQQRAGVSLKGGVGAVGDPYEHHADRVADLVVRGDSAAGALGDLAGPPRTDRAVQRAVQREAKPAFNTPAYALWQRMNNQATDVQQRFFGQGYTEATLPAAGRVLWQQVLSYEAQHGTLTKRIADVRGFIAAWPKYHPHQRRPVAAAPKPQAGGAKPRVIPKAPVIAKPQQATTRAWDPLYGPDPAVEAREALARGMQSVQMLQRGNAAGAGVTFFAQPAGIKAKVRPALIKVISTASGRLLPALATAFKSDPIINGAIQNRIIQLRKLQPPKPVVKPPAKVIAKPPVKPVVKPPAKPVVAKPPAKPIAKPVANDNKSSTVAKPAAAKGPDLAAAAKADSAKALLAIVRTPGVTPAVKAAAIARYRSEFLRLEPDLLADFGLTVKGATEHMIANDIAELWSGASSSLLKGLLRTAYVERLKAELARHPDHETLQRDFNLCPFADSKPLIRTEFLHLVAKDPTLARYKPDFGLPPDGGFAADPTTTSAHDAPAPHHEVDVETSSSDDLIDELDHLFKSLVGDGDVMAKLKGKFSVPISPIMKLCYEMQLSGGYSGGKFKIGGSMSAGLAGEVDAGFAKLEGELKGTFAVEAEGADPKAAVRMLLLGLRRRIETIDERAAQQIYGKGEADTRGLKGGKSSLSMAVGASATFGASDAEIKISLSDKLSFDTKGDTGIETSSNKVEAGFEIKGGWIESECKVGLKQTGPSKELSFSAKGTFKQDTHRAMTMLGSQVAAVALDGGAGGDAFKRLGKALHDQLVALTARLPKGKEGEAEMTFEVGATCVDGRWEGSIKLAHQRKVEVGTKIWKLDGSIEATLDTTIMEVKFTE